MSFLQPNPEQRLAMRERPRGLGAMKQRWSALLFLHWKIDPDWIQSRLPEGLYVDTFDGEAWIGVVPFFMQRIRPVGLPAVPWFSWFLELNVRTYVHDSKGNPGVWFFSLDCNQPLAVEIARKAFHLPYEHSSMKAVRDGGHLTYESHRRSPGAGLAAFHYDMPGPGEPAEPGTLEWFLVERYLLFSADRRGRIFTGRVHHRPYHISKAHCERWSTEPLRLNGFPEPTSAPDSLLVAEPVDVTVFPLGRS